MNAHSTNPNRVPAGVTTGGQFAHGAKAEAGVSLLAPAGGAPSPRQAAQAKANQIADWARQCGEDWDFKVGEQYPDWAAAELAPTLNRDVVIDEYFHPMTVAATRALKHADNYPNAEAEFNDLHAKLTDRLEREERWQADPDFQAPGYDYSEQHAGGPVVYRTSVGDKYADAPRDTAEIAKRVRTDIKQAKANGYLPEHIDVSVRTRKFSGGSAIDVYVDGMTDDEIYQPVDANDPPYWGKRCTASAQETRERIMGLTGAYGRRETSIETDYFNVSYYHNVTLVDEQAARWNAEIKAEAKAKRDARAAARQAA